MTPALRAIRGHCPNGELHLLVPEEIAPLFQHLPWLDRVWPMPRRRGSASLGQTWPVVRALRRERFDRSVDFASNDRGAILSFLIGARRRLGWAQRGGFFGRRFCYHQRVVRENKLEHESSRMMYLLSAWDIAPGSLEPEIRTDPALDAAAQKFLPERKIICHLASSQPKKEWPLTHWVALYQLAAAAGLKLIFATGTGAREESLLAQFQAAGPGRTGVAADSRTWPCILPFSSAPQGLSRATPDRCILPPGWACRRFRCLARAPPCGGRPIGEQHQVADGKFCVPVAMSAFARVRIIASQPSRQNRFSPACKIF